MKPRFRKQKTGYVSTCDSSLGVKLLSDTRGVIPLVWLVALGVIALAGATGVIGFLIGSKFSFLFGLILAIVLLIAIPNLTKLISWSKSVKKEIEK